MSKKIFETGIVIKGDESGALRALKATSAEIGKFDQAQQRSSKSQQQAAQIARRLTAENDKLREALARSASTQDLAVQAAKRYHIEVENQSAVLAQSSEHWLNWRSVAVGAVSAVSAVMITQSIHATKELVAMSDALGMSSQKMAEFQYAAAQQNVGAESALALLKDVAEKFGEAARNGGGEAVELLKSLSLEAADFVKLKPDQMILKLGAALESVGTEAEKSALLEMVGNDLTKLLPLLRNGAEQYYELAEQGRRFNAVMSDFDNQKIADMSDALGRLYDVGQGSANGFLASLAPFVTDAADLAVEHIDELTLAVDLLAGTLAARFVSSAFASIAAMQASRVASAQQTAATLASAKAAEAKALSAHRVAQSEQAAAARALANARAMTVASQATYARAKALDALAVANGRVAATEAALHAANQAASGAGRGAGALTSALGLFGGPWGLAVVAGISAVTFAMDAQAKQAEETAAILARVTEQASQAVAEQNTPQALQAALAQEQTALAELQQHIDATRTKMATLRSQMDQGGNPAALVALAQTYAVLEQSVKSSDQALAEHQAKIDAINQNLHQLGVQTGTSAQQTLQQKEKVESLTQALQQQALELELGARALLEHKLAEERATPAQIKAALAAFDKVKALKLKAKAEQQAAEAAKKRHADQQREQQQLAQWYANYQAQVDPAAAAQAAYNDTLVKLQQLLPETSIEYKRAADHAKKVRDQALAGNTKDLQVLDNSFTEAAKRIDAVFASAWVNIDEGFDGLVGGIQSSFTQMLAEMAHEALTKPILLNVQQGMSGLFEGAAGTAASSATGSAASSAATAGISATAGYVAAGALLTVAAINAHNAADDKRMQKYTAEYRQGVQSTGTVLGDLSAKSHSVANLTELLAEQGADVLGVNHGMLQSLRNIETGLTQTSNGIARQLTRSGGLEDYQASSGGYYSGSIHTDVQAAVLGNVGEFLGSIVDGVLGEVSSFIYNKKKTLQDAGIAFADQALGAIIDSGLVQAQGYQQVRTTRSFLGFKRSSTSTDYQDLDDALQYQLGSVFANASNLLISVGDELQLQLGTATDDYVRSLSVKASNLSLKGLKGDELSAEIEAYLSSTMDNWATQMLAAAGIEGWIEQYQQAGEGLFETLGRLTSQSQAWQVEAEKLNLQFGATGLDSAELTQQLALMSGGFSQLLANSNGYYQAFFTEEEQFEYFSGQLSSAMGELGSGLFENRAQFRALVEAQNLTTEAGQRQYAALMNLAPAMDRYITGVEKTAEAERQRLQTISDFDSGIQTQLDRLGLDGQDLELFNLDQEFDRLREEAKKVGGDLTLVEALYGQKRLDIVEQYAQQADEAERQRLQTIDDFNSGIQTQLDQFGLDGQDLELFNLDQEFDRLRAEAEKVGGDLTLVEALYGRKRADIVAQYAQKALDAERQQLQDALTPYLQNLADWSSEELSRIESDYKERIALAEQQMRVGRELRQYVEQLKISDLSPYDPGEKLQLASESFAKLLVQAENGDMDAAGQLQSAAQTYLQNADGYYGRSSAYSSIFAEVAQALDDLGLNIAGGLDDKAIEKLNAQMLTEQQRIRDYAREQLDWTVSQHAALTSIEDLLKLLPESLSDQLATLSGQTAAPASSTESLILSQWQQMGGGAYSETDLASLVAQVESGQLAMSQVTQELAYYQAHNSQVMQQVLDLWNSTGGGEFKDADLSRYVVDIVAGREELSLDDLNYYRAHGSHAKGLNSVPFDGYRAELHKNEMILTADVADHIRQSMRSVTKQSTVVVQTDPALMAELKALRVEVAQFRLERARSAQKAEQQRNEQQRATESVARAAKTPVGVI